MYQHCHHIAFWRIFSRGFSRDALVMHMLTSICFPWVNGSRVRRSGGKKLRSRHGGALLQLSLIQYIIRSILILTLLRVFKGSLLRTYKNLQIQLLPIIRSLDVSYIFFLLIILYFMQYTTTGNSQKDRRLGRQKKAENTDGIVTYLSFFAQKGLYRLTGTHKC